MIFYHIVTIEYLLLFIVIYRGKYCIFKMYFIVKLQQKMFRYPEKITEKFAENFSQTT